ncbi:N-(5'phosphoribosyl)anthranilate isomerase [Leptospira kirschneri str. 200803703]|uniref:N-(5'-phosphoribosyl)anthranilate isomerase n=2 Tax=Leptospira kirschneri TaxID=29507 RepID=A0A828XUU9_9LEPT|nr:N-(5'phosphoribosyl)anthranilate isomerase [Leptospira kirschneri str. 200802841]EKP03436.1 N-(5'phosphoribosyl)anthranilate isomerase [Leptospira kirschneri str. 2008720114]EKQ81971.1 N-(5'phosphoribosyl)anthranilate isomerase [Leptospira kirschneri serovar Grippotyphosa str. Moskva]EKR09934.1 N-(5'phosphoribosyl)anthranilate isomerase [Leptospira kirschneri serovar Valbuzzi str. 200702274]EMK05314.1 N-(5'phosphoribosyl)anthranilate isomerase [Leptospira kirschneri str. MMD1493]EMK16338.1 
MNSLEKTKIKICGIKNIEIAKICKEEGADYIGLNFVSSSPRKIELSNAQKIVEYYRSEKNSPEIVLLFYQNSFEEIESITSILDHDLVQWVWGDPSVSKEKLLVKRQICSYRVQAPINDQDLKDIVAEFLILDSYSKGIGGGTGETFNWEFISKIKRKFLLAGGLDPSNVVNAIEIVKPFGVDVASGVESSPGIKDPQKVIQFIRNVKSTS